MDSFQRTDIVSSTTARLIFHEVLPVRHLSDRIRSSLLSSASSDLFARHVCRRSFGCANYPRSYREGTVSMQFSDLRLAEPLLRALVSEGYQTATPIQAKAIPPVLEGRDVMGAAQTGTGKTAAFALPILQRLS